MRLETPNFPSHDSEEVGRGNIIDLFLGAPSPVRGVEGFSDKEKR